MLSWRYLCAPSFPISLQPGPYIFWGAFHCTALIWKLARQPPCSELL